MAIKLFWVTCFKKIFANGPVCRIFAFLVIEKLSYKEDNLPKEYSRRKEHFKIDVWIYKPETR